MSERHSGEAGTGAGNEVDSPIVRVKHPRDLGPLFYMENYKVPNRSFTFYILIIKGWERVGQRISQLSLSPKIDPRKSIL